MRLPREEWGTKLVRAVLQAFGVTMICLLVEISPLVSSWHVAVYQFDGPASDLFLPVLVNILVLWMAMTGLILLSERGGRLGATIWGGMMLVLPWVGLKEGTMAAAYIVPHWLSATVLDTALVGTVALQVFYKPKLGAWIDKLLPAFKTVLYALSISGVLMLGQLLYFFVQARGLNDATTLHVAGAAAGRTAGPKRMIVILFDELSYEQTYGNRSAKLQLPAFDGLAAEATVMRDVRPAAEYTNRALPALLTGHAVQEIRSSADGRRLALNNQQGWSELDPQETVFGDALKLGYRTGLAGWYNPYCRILPQVLDRCTWRAHSILPHMIANDSAPAGDALLTNSVEPLRGFLRKVPGFFDPKLRGGEPDEELLARHVRDYEEIARDADSLLSDPAMTFVFLHMPMPHPGGIYDRRRGVMAKRTTSYLDNLALADRYLGHVRELLMARGDWDDSVVMVLGDHSWRLPMWELSAFWTEEDQETIEGKVLDDRPAMVVKLAKGAGDGVGAAHIDTAFEATRTRWMVDELMTGRMQTKAELARWVEEQAR